MSRRGRVLAPALAAVLIAGAGAAGAQDAGAERTSGRVEVGGGGGFFRGAGLGSADASLRAREGGDYRLFRVDSRMNGAPVVEARAAVALSRRYAVEARVGFSRPELRSAISQDVEGAPPVTIGERLDQYVVEGALLVMLDRLRVAGLTPFASGGAGYLRQLHEGRTLVEQGVAYHAGGGVRRLLFTRERGWLKSGGVRGEARLYLFSGGAAPGEGLSPRVAAAGSFFVMF